MRSKHCACFYCGTVFPSSAITNWTDRNEYGEGQTALCPNCGIDSVIGDGAGYELSVEFLIKMHAKWF